MTTPAELKAIRERDARSFASTKHYVAEGTMVMGAREDRRTLLALYDAQSDEVRRLREALADAQLSIDAAILRLLGGKTT